MLMISHSPNVYIYTYKKRIGEETGMCEMVHLDTRVL